MGEVVIRQCGAREEQQPTKDDPRPPLRRDIQHRDEQAEEQQRRPQVAFEHQDGEGDQPGDHQRPEILQSGKLDTEKLRSDYCERISLRDEITGEEDGQQNLRGFCGLEGQITDTDPQRRAVDGGADRRDQGENQQHQTDEAEGVGIAREPAVVLQQDEDGNEQNDRDGEPRQLRVDIGRRQR